MSAQTIRLLLREKECTIAAVAPEISAFGALAIMWANKTGAVLVVEHSRLLGIFSAKDYASRVVLQGRDGHDIAVREAMTSPVVSARPDLNILSAMKMMVVRDIRHLPIVEDERIVGGVTLADLVRTVMKDQDFTIQQMTQYISGR